ncbi:MAG: DUF5989 family protein [Pirellulales bacterium]|nr:DUF5989 family protein [Pirellulales bacterium]
MKDADAPEPSLPPTGQDQVPDAELSPLSRLPDQDPGLIQEFVSFLRYNKKWWLTPALIAMLLLVGVVFLAASPAAPFIYTLF